MISPKTKFPAIVRQTSVSGADGMALTVSTVQVAPDYFDTVVFDGTADKRHAGMVLPGHVWEGRTYGPYVIDRSNERATTRESALDQHRAALLAARTETPSPTVEARLQAGRLAEQRHQLMDPSEPPLAVAL